MIQYAGKNQESLLLDTNIGELSSALRQSLPNALTFIWLRRSQEIQVDGACHLANANTIICITEFHRLDTHFFNDARFIRFNRSFYCIKDHDDEVSCKGMLFFNSSHPSCIEIPETELYKFDLLWNMFEVEMNTSDTLQFEMLQMMLKRFIILCTRLYKSQNPKLDIQVKSLDIVRTFNYLVETHFRAEHKVAAYAGLLNKSPKTLTNVFAQHKLDSPSTVIQNRIMLEARRLLRYTDKSIKEIAYSVGYEDVQRFSRAFRQREGLAPSDFRDQRN